MKNTILDYFLKYVKIDTMSMENVDKVPSTEKQFDLARVLVQDLKELGLEDIKMSDNCFVTAVLKSNCNSNLHIGFIAHMDTIPGFSGTNVKPQVIKNYDGNEIKLTGITTNENASISMQEETEPRYFYVDDTFALFLREEGRDKPYFAARISDITKEALYKMIEEA